MVAFFIAQRSANTMSNVIEFKQNIIPDLEPLFLDFVVQDGLEAVYNSLVNTFNLPDIPPIKAEDTKRVVNCSMWNACVPVALEKLKREQPDLYWKAANESLHANCYVDASSTGEEREAAFRYSWYYFTKGVDDPTDYLQ